MSISVWGCPGGGASVLYVHLPDNPVLLYSLLSVEWRRQSVTWWAPLHAYDGASSSHKKLQPQYGRPHTGANGVSWPPRKMDEKLEKRKHAKTVMFYVYVIFWEQSGQAAVENSAMLTTYLFRYTSECTISWSNFQNFLRLRRQGGIDPLTKILRTFLSHRP